MKRQRRTGLIISEPSGLRVGMHLLDGEGAADDILRELLKTSFLMGFGSLVAVDAETGCFQFQQHPGTGGRPSLANYGDYGAIRVRP